MSILPQLTAQTVNFILTDPPYIARYKSRDGRTVPNGDNFAWLKPAFAEMYRDADRFMQAYRAAGCRIVGHFAFPLKQCKAFAPQ